MVFNLSHDGQDNPYHCHDDYKADTAPERKLKNELKPEVAAMPTNPEQK